MGRFTSGSFLLLEKLKEFKVAISRDLLYKSALGGIFYKKSTQKSGHRNRAERRASVTIKFRVSISLRFC